MTEADPVAVAVVTDRSYLPWAATLLQSCIDAGEANLHVHVLHDGSLPPGAVAKLRTMLEDRGELSAHEVPSRRLGDLPAVDRFGPVVWMRFLLPELLPELPRVLYLDADTFVVSRLTELWRTPLGGSPVAAVANVVEEAMFDHLADLDIEDPTQFFNSGVLLMNLEVMREERSLAQLAAYAKENAEKLVWPDQDALNGVFAGRWLALHPRWNAQNSLWFWPERARAVFGAGIVDEATDGPAILHFEGDTLAKPWHYLSRHPWRYTYRRTLARTPWAGTPLEDRTALTRLVRLLPPSTRTGAYRRVLEHRRRHR